MDLYKILRINDRPVRTIREVMCDTIDELLALSPEDYAAGSVAYLPGLNQVWQMGTDGQWHLLPDRSNRSN